MLGALIGAGASLISGFMGKSSADKAASAQAKAAKQSLKLQREMWETSRSDMMPWLDAGKTALSTYMGQLDGTGDPNAFKATPGYDWRVKQGEQGVLNNLTAMGMKNSGKALKALETFRQGIASQEYGTWMDRLAGVSGTGQNTSNSMAGYSANAANNMGQTMQDAGQARASGYVGGANSMMAGLSGAANFMGQAFGGNRFPAAPSGASNGFRSMIYG